jgi:hypothetical protein
MTIDFQCACGKKFRVADEYAGKRAKCKSCGEMVMVPNPGQSTIRITKREGGTTAVAPLVASAPAPPLVKPKPTAAPTPPPTLAPGVVQGWMLYPVVPLICGLLAVGIIVAAIALKFYALAAALLLPLGILIWHHRSVKARVGQLKVEPGLIISIDPPMVATLLDLSQGNGSWDYIRISATALPSQVQRGGRHPMAVQRFESPGANHFTDASCQSLTNLTTDPKTLAAAVGTISEARWQEFHAAWETILQQDTPGLYKVPTKPRQGMPIPREKLEQIVSRCLGHNPNLGRYMASAGLPPPVLQAAQANYASDLDSSSIIALVKCDHDDSGRLSLLFDELGLRFKIRDDLGTDIAWADLWSVGIVGRDLEIVMTSGLRMAIPTRTFAKNAAAIELALAQICELP